MKIVSVLLDFSVGDDVGPDLFGEDILCTLEGVPGISTDEAGNLRFEPVRSGLG